MEFMPESETEFIRIFRNAELKIRTFDGCKSLSFFREIGPQCVYFTISEWETVGHLEAYRNSPLFSTTWNATKALFSGPPRAWSLEKQ